MILAKAEVYYNEGNEEYKKENFSNALHFYTEGLNVNCKDEELRAKLYSSRAEAHFSLGEITIIIPAFEVLSRVFLFYY